MPVHSIICINGGGNVIYSTYFLDAAASDYNTRLYFEQRLFKLTSPLWSKVGTNPRTVMVGDVVVVFQMIGDMIVFANGVDDVDESGLTEILQALEKVLLDLLESKISEALLLVPENYGKFVISVDDMMPQGIVETLDAGLIGRLSKLKTIS